MSDTKTKSSSPNSPDSSSSSSSSSSSASSESDQRHDEAIYQKQTHVRSPLHQAAIDLDRENFVDFLGENPSLDLHKRDNNGQTALMLAVMYGNQETIAVLLQRDPAGINLKNKEGLTPLMLVITRFAYEPVLSNRTETNEEKAAVKAAIEGMLSDGKSVDEIAAVHSLKEMLAVEGIDPQQAMEASKKLVDKKRISIIYSLIENGADVNIKDSNGSSAFNLADEKKQDDVKKYLLEKIDKEIEFFRAIQKSETEIMMHLLQKGADFSHKNEAGKNAYVQLRSIEESYYSTLTPKKISNYRETKQYKETRLLLDYLNPNLVKKVKNSSFLFATSKKIQRQPGPNAAICRAAFFGYIDFVKFLFEKGAEGTYVNRFDSTPLMSAVAGGHKELVAFLLEREDVRSTLDFKNKDRKTAFDLAKGNKDITTLLRDVEPVESVGFGAN